LAVPKARRILKELGALGADIKALLDLTYLHEESTEIIPPLRDFFAEERQRLRLDLLAHRQNNIQGRESKLQEEIPSEPNLEARWALQFGIDKKTEESTRQIIWSWLFVPIVLNLRKYIRGRKRENYGNDLSIMSDNVFQTASTLVHLRYPTLWEDRWILVKKRFHLFLGR
jgi:hypothetical protein